MLTGQYHYTRGGQALEIKTLVILYQPKKRKGNKVREQKKEPFMLQSFFAVLQFCIIIHCMCTWSKETLSTQLASECCH